jgi:RNA polymerase II subunit A C-terminal domain phosphatase
LAAERTGYSRLKEGITADELATQDETASNGSRRSSPKIVAQENMDDQDGEGDDEEEEDDEEDDFLARELEEEWG